MRSIVGLFGGLLSILIFFSGAEASSWYSAKVRANKAIVYSDPQLDSPIGKVSRGKTVVAMKKKKNGGTIPILVAGKVAYVRGSDLQYTKKKAKLRSNVQSKKTLFSFFTVSKGTLEQDNTTGDVVTYEQNSPATIGLYGNYRPARARYSWQSSVYFSFLQPGEVSGSDSLSPPPEIGVNAYWQYEKGSFSFSTGVDYERLSYFNLNSTNVSDLGVVTEALTYWTGGIGYFTFPWLTKVSFSKSLASTGELSGWKGIFYLGFFTKIKWQLHLLYKYHALKTSTNQNLTIQRIGLGFGYTFF